MEQPMQNRNELASDAIQNVPMRIDCFVDFFMLATLSGLDTRPEKNIAK
jgi:hypothetical protein